MREPEKSEGYFAVKDHDDTVEITDFVATVEVPDGSLTVQVKLYVVVVVIAFVTETTKLTPVAFPSVVRVGDMLSLNVSPAPWARGAVPIDRDSDKRTVSSRRPLNISLGNI